MRNRNSIRLNGYDYSKPGFYFITIVTHVRECLFGDVLQGSMNLSSVGHMVQDEIIDLSKRFDSAVIDSWVEMPNHVHCIIELSKNKMSTFHSKGEHKVHPCSRDSNSRGEACLRPHTV